MSLDLADMKQGWRAPGGALLVGLPLTVVGIAVAAHLLTGLAWLPALLLGAILSPTDPVFASAIVERTEIPRRLRHLLNVESGANDGLALPIVVALLAVSQGEHPRFLPIAEEVVYGAVLGVAIPLAVVWLSRLPWLGAAAKYEPLLGFAIGLIVLALARLAHVNEFLGAFAAGVTVGAYGPEAAGSFRSLGGSISELLKLAAVLVFGAFLSPSSFTEAGVSGYLFAICALVVVRPLALAAPLWGRLSLPEFLAAAWFGPKGFASVFFGLLILNSHVADSGRVFNLAALVIAMSMIAHPSTDVLVVRWFANKGEDQEMRGSQESRRAS
jgi:NhaP-type Na+/H+ or K+/H+ antiporter